MPQAISKDLSEDKKRFLRAVINLAGQPDFEAIKSYFSQRLLWKALTNIHGKDDHRFRWEQGAAQELQLLLQMMAPEKANEMLTELNKKPNEPPSTI